MHDVRHSTITNYAAETGSSFAVMTMAGHRTLASTRPYLHLAGRAFPEEAAALEKRYGGNLYPPLYRPDPTSDDLTAPEPLGKDGSDAG